MAVKLRDAFRLKFKRNLINKSLRYCSANSSIIPPLTLPLPNVKDRPNKSKILVDEDKSFRTTVLENGVKVASENSFGQFCTVGVLVDAGSRQEIDYPSGVTHLLERLAFQSNSKYANLDDVFRSMEELGGHLDCMSSRDCMLYAGSAYKHNLEGAVDILKHAVWNPKISEDEVEQQKQTIAFEHEEFEYRPDREPQLTDLVHGAAFSSNTVGLPKICPLQTVPKLNSDLLNHFIQRYYRPRRLTLAAVNVDHNELVSLAQRLFVEEAPEWTRSPGLKMDESLAQYTGGQVLEHKPGPRLQPGHTQLPELVHISLGFEAADYTHDDMFSFAVLNMLLGGGGAFSAGGPGKGMYSRLYRNVLNRNHWMFSSTAFSHSYKDSGLFCIHSSAHPSQARDILRVITDEYLKLVQSPFHHEEVARAKKQLQSMLIMNLESRVVRFEDMGRQILGVGHRKSAEEYYDSIENVTADDLLRISESMLNTKPSVAAIGDLTNMPDYEDIQNAVAKRTRLSTGLSRYFNFKSL